MSGRRQLMIAANNGRELVIEMGLDTEIAFRIVGDTIVADGWDYGGIGTHDDLEWNYPELYFGEPKCYANGRVWDLREPLRLRFTPTKVAQVELLESGRGSVSVGEMDAECYIVWTDTEITVSDGEGSSSRYLIKITFE